MTATGMKKIDSRLERLEPGTLRHEIMTALRQFRASWVELGRLLNEVAIGGDYKEWGYEKFEVYCARELGLKQPTVQKLMVSYNYMKKYESNRLNDFETQPDKARAANIPDFQTVELLEKVRQREEAPEEKIMELHRRAFEDEGAEPELRKEIRQVLRSPLGEDEIKAGAEARKTEMAGILRAARELRRRIAATHAIPGGLKERLERCLTELEALD